MEKTTPKAPAPTTDELIAAVRASIASLQESLEQLGHLGVGGPIARGVQDFAHAHTIFVQYLEEVLKPTEPPEMNKHHVGVD